MDHAKSIGHPYWLVCRGCRAAARKGYCRMLHIQSCQGQIVQSFFFVVLRLLPFLVLLLLLLNGCLPQETINHRAEKKSVLWLGWCTKQHKTNGPVFPFWQAKWITCLMQETMKQQQHHVISQGNGTEPETERVRETKLDLKIMQIRKCLSSFIR